MTAALVILAASVLVLLLLCCVLLLAWQGATFQAARYRGERDQARATLAAVRGRLNDRDRPALHAVDD